MFKRNFNIKIGSSFLRLIDKLMGKKIYLLIIFALLFLLSGCSSYDKNGFNNITKRNWHSMSNYDPEGYDFLVLMPMVSTEEDLMQLDGMKLLILLMTMLGLTVKIFIEILVKNLMNVDLTTRNIIFSLVLLLIKMALIMREYIKLPKENLILMAGTITASTKKHRIITMKRALIVTDMIKMGIIKKDIPEKI